MISQAEQKVSMREKAGYSLGDVSANLVFQMLMVYQLKFYTDIFGLDGAVAGSVLLFAPLLCAFFDPLAGIIADRTRSRWGKYRPWILWTALPFSIFYILAFSNPGIQDKTLVAIYATVSYILLLTLYGLNNTPYASLGGVMTLPQGNATYFCIGGDAAYSGDAAEYLLNGEVGLARMYSSALTAPQVKRLYVDLKK